MEQRRQGKAQQAARQGDGEEGWPGGQQVALDRIAQGFRRGFARRRDVGTAAIPLMTSSPPGGDGRRR